MFSRFPRLSLASEVESGQGDLETQLLGEPGKPRPFKIPLQLGTGPRDELERQVSKWGKTWLQSLKTCFQNGTPRVIRTPDLRIRMQNPLGFQCRGNRPIQAPGVIQSDSGNRGSSNLGLSPRFSDFVRFDPDFSFSKKHREGGDGFGRITPKTRKT